MEILKWYSIGFIGVGILIQIINSVIDHDLGKRITSLLDVLLEIPILVYLILK